MPNVAATKSVPKRTPSSHRKADILAAAARAFAETGFQGASLRHIASAAGVSLTLLDHYFGSKASLLQAVVDNHHAVCKDRMVALREIVIGDDGPIPMATFVAEWVRYEYDLYTSPQGEHYLVLMLKLANEAEIDVSIRRRLNCSEAVVLRGFERAAPGTTKECRLSAFSAASSALHAGIKDFGVAVDEGKKDAEEIAIAFTTKFLLAGLAASLKPKYQALEREVILNSLGGSLVRDRGLSPREAEWVLQKVAPRLDWPR